MPRRRYSVTLAGEAERDLDAILVWTRDTFGAHQAEVYARTIRAAFEALGLSLTPSGAKARNEIGAGYHSLHIARQRRRGRHVLIYRELSEGRIVIARILHDSMDIARHLPADDE
jgi:toxin ParE1/3/4